MLQRVVIIVNFACSSIGFLTSHLTDTYVKQVKLLDFGQNGEDVVDPNCGHLLTSVELKTTENEENGYVYS